MNIKLLKEVAEEILARPKQVAMDTWFSLKKGAGTCGTTACIAGWALTLHYQEKTKLMPLKMAKLVEKRFVQIEKDKFLSHTSEFHTKSSDSAQKLLKLDGEQAENLFHQRNWPEYFKNKMVYLREGSKAYARVVHDRILFFIATNGTDRLE